MSVSGLKQRRRWPTATEAFESARGRAAVLIARVPPMALAYAVPTVAAAAAVQTWFRGDTVLAGGDTPPPLATDRDYLAHWNYEDGGEGAPSYAIIALPYVETLRLVAWLGLSEPMFQRLWLTVVVAGVAAAVVYLARGVGLPPLAAAVAGFVAVFNAHFLAIGFDWVPFAAMLTAALLGGMLVRVGGERPPPVLLFALASLLIGPVFANPALVALVLAWLCVSVAVSVAVHGRTALRRCAGFLARAAPFALLFNLWWLVPALQTISSDVFGERFAAPGADDWSWTHARASLANVIGLTSNWIWPRAEYLPFAAGLERPPFDVLQYLPALAGALGVILSGRRHRRVALVLGGTGLIAVWVMKGVHAPLGGANRWVYESVPGFWLLRDPAKAGLVLVLVLSLLTAIALARLIGSSRLVGACAAAVVVAGVLAYAHPFLTGAVVPDARPLLPSDHVRVPNAWRAAADFVDDAAAPGKVLVLPQLDYYQAPTTWGYYGASFLHRLFELPVIEVRPGGYYEDRAVDGLVRSLERDLLARRNTVLPLLRALGVRYVLLRRDLDTSFPDRSFTDPAVLAGRLRELPTLRHARSFGLVDAYEVPAVATAEVYPAVPLFEDAGVTGTLPRLLAAAPGAAGIPDSAAVRGIPSAHLRVVAVAPGTKRLSVSPTSGGVRVRLRPAYPRSRTATRVLEFPEVGTPFELLAGDARLPVARRPKTILVTTPDAEDDGTIPATRRIALGPAAAQTLGDCNRYDERGLRAVGIAARVDESATPTLRLQARDHAACVALPLAAADSLRRFRLHLEYRGIRGEPPRICVWQDGPDRCLPLPPLDASSGWHSLDATVTPHREAEATRIFLYADGAQGRLTETAYRSLAVSPVGEALVVGVVADMRLPRISYRKLAAGEFRVRVRGATSPFLLVITETFAPGWKIEAADIPAGDPRHVRVNGYANGWLIPWTGSYELTARYEPERRAKFAGYVDLVALPLALVALILLTRRRRPAVDRARFPRLWRA